jgi:hypothetical protein
MPRYLAAPDSRPPVPTVRSLPFHTDGTAAADTQAAPLSLRLQAMHEQLTSFRQHLEEFAHKHRGDIRRDPVFRAQFHTMCANIGVDPLTSNKARPQHTCICRPHWVTRTHAHVHRARGPRDVLFATAAL